MKNESTEQEQKQEKRDIILIPIFIVIAFLMMGSIGVHLFHSIKQAEITVLDIHTNCTNITPDCIDSDQTIRIHVADSTIYHLVDNETRAYDGFDKQTFDYDLFSYRFANYLRLREGSTYMVSYTGEQIKIWGRQFVPTILSVDAIHQNWGVNETGFFEFISFDEIEKHYCVLKAKELNQSTAYCNVNS